jgi:cytochrome b subunit of formate dehydrogenase
MVWLLRITLTIFGVHTILWMVRFVIDRIRFGPHKKTKSKYRYLRFKPIDRFLHALVIISFLLLALTGLPLKYSHTEASYWIASNLLDLKTMALLHRIGAGITFAYFFLHLLTLTIRMIRDKKPLKSMLWGPDSMMVQPHDAVDFWRHIKYFLHLGPKPQFGRFSYWEKFDYMAVFWGVAVIGASGLTLWFPTFFTQFLPGWVLNAAFIIHSEEALLATGFIFTIHFFNEHLRPENFPFDEVIFTGTMSEHYLKEERQVWYERIKAQGKLEEIRRKPMKTFPRTLLYIFGFLALLIGLGLLALIVIGTFTNPAPL